MELVLLITQFVIHFLSVDFYNFGKYPLIWEIKTTTISCIHREVQLIPLKGDRGQLLPKPREYNSHSERYIQLDSLPCNYSGKKVASTSKMT